MSLQSKYRLERDGISTVENENYYFAYRIVENEFFVDEVYIKEEKRGNSKIYFDEIFSFIKNYDVKYIVCTVVPRMPNSERAMVSLLKYGFKLLKCDNLKIFLYMEV